ncbi:MAG: S-layer homology domain-containing protein [Actinomycetes bacterium]
MPISSLVRTRRWTVVVVMSVLVGSIAAPSMGAEGFEDVPPGHTFAEDIEWLADQGITRGCNPPTNTRFCPDDLVTRGQMAAFLVRALGLPPAPDQEFRDSGGTFKADIDSLAAAGITRGCNPPTNDRFCPDDYVTRGQMAAFLVRALGLPPAPDQEFRDSGGTFKADIDSLAAAGITRGCNPPTNDRFCPEELVTRGQMAAFLHRALTATTRAIDVSVGHFHACAVSEEGRVYCWGSNRDGQLGVPETSSSSVPVLVPGLTNVISVSAGGSHTCATTESGQAYCWGQGANGRLGTGSNESTSTPKRVVGLTNVVAVEAGENSTCALRDNGRVYCWGFGENGRLGHGSNASSNTPVQVTGITDAVTLSVGYSHACITDEFEEAWCWGDTGRFGNGTAGTGVSSRPVKVDLASVFKAEAGTRHTCALVLEGGLRCWGYNEAGQLGLGDKDERNEPATVSGMGAVLDVYAGHHMSCALNAEADVYCWGTNRNGTLAIGSRGEDVLVPKKTLLDRVALLDVAYNNGCAVSVDGEVSCWGDNMLGQLGIGTTGGVHPSPRRVLLLR